MAAAVKVCVSGVGRKRVGWRGEQVASATDSWSIPAVQGKRQLLSSMLSESRSERKRMCFMQKLSKCGSSE